ncbi:MAG: Chemotaxis response regulator protein-glutamate methylesterase CheB [Sphingobacteriales bacterium]|nr:Chemotaxis response regulator protein-glutamate methylesterase CheB [Sphingobacteriales bacterium]
MSDIKNMVVIGASAGGYNAVTELLSKLSPTCDAAIFVVLHLSKKSIADVIARYYQKHTPLVCKVAEHEEIFMKGHVYLAPADCHMIIDENQILLTKGAPENHWRPSIDVLFCSAAVAHTSKVIGIILSGLLDDGTSGMYAIKRSGGICIIQEPSEADFPDMPANVLKSVDVDFKVLVADMEYLLEELFKKPIDKNMNVPGKH